MTLEPRLPKQCSSLLPYCRSLGELRFKLRSRGLQYDRHSFLPIVRHPPAYQYLFSVRCAQRCSASRNTVLSTPDHCPGTLTSSEDTLLCREAPGEARLEVRPRLSAGLEQAGPFPRKQRVLTNPQAESLPATILNQNFVRILKFK